MMNKKVYTNNGLFLVYHATALGIVTAAHLIAPFAIVAEKIVRRFPPCR